MEKIDLFTLISLIVAVVVILKLRSVLGRRTGDEEARVERYRSERARQEAAAASGDNVVAMPRRERDSVTPTGAAEVTQADAEERIKTYPSIEAAARGGLIEIARLDPAFDPDVFIRGAKQAYEMIVTAFAEGNRKLLRDLLSRDVYDGFAGAIGEREARGEQVDQSFVGIEKADILESEVKGGIASITVRFVSELISATRDKAGAIISGDPQRIKEVTDIWTFSRDVSTAKTRAIPTGVSSLRSRRLEGQAGGNALERNRFCLKRDHALAFWLDRRFTLRTDGVRSDHGLAEMNSAAGMAAPVRVGGRRKRPWQAIAPWLLSRCVSSRPCASAA